MRMTFGWALITGPPKGARAMPWAQGPNPTLHTYNHFGWISTPVIRDVYFSLGVGPIRNTQQTAKQGSHKKEKKQQTSTHTNMLVDH